MCRIEKELNFFAVCSGSRLRYEIKEWRTQEECKDYYLNYSPSNQNKSSDNPKSEKVSPTHNFYKKCDSKWGNIDVKGNRKTICSDGGFITLAASLLA